MPQTKLFQQLAGIWEGTCLTWFEPGKLADESPIRCEFTPVLSGRFLRHVYSGMIQGKPRNGEELIAFNAITQEFQTAWIDDFHMNYAMMWSAGQPLENGFSVLGEYDVGEGQPKWGWRTQYELYDNDHLTITAYNVTPQGDEAKAVEATCTRVTAVG